jgi:REP element-mobilizing transposase RayT
MNNIARNTVFKVNRHAEFKLKFILVVKVLEAIKIIDQDLEYELKEVAKNIFTSKNSHHIDKIIFSEKNSVQIHFEILSIKDLDCRKLINSFKTVSSRTIRSKYFEKLKDANLEKGFWEQKYFLMTKEFN